MDLKDQYCMIFVQYEMSTTGKSRETERRLEVDRAGGRQNGEWLLSGDSYPT